MKPLASSYGLSDSKLETLIDGYWNANRHKPFISSRRFLTELDSILMGTLQARRLTLVAFDQSLPILIEECSLSTHCFTDTTSHSPLFQRWLTTFPGGSIFGGQVIHEDSDISGINGFVLIQDENFILDRLVNATKTHIAPPGLSRSPTTKCRLPNGILS